MNQDDLKRRVAKAALKYVEEDTIVGVGTGSTVNYFIEELATMKGRIDGAVSSSEATTKLLKQRGITVYDLNSVDNLPLYIDGADEATKHLQLIKGGGGALTREKICAAVAKQFICMIDKSKLVDVLGRFPVAVEVIPAARSYVARQIVKLNGQPVYREGFVTDNGNIIIDVFNFNIMNAVALEEALNQITGVVCNGIFAKRPADKILCANENGVDVLS